MWIFYNPLDSNFSKKHVYLEKNNAASDIYLHKHVLAHPSFATILYGLHACFRLSILRKLRSAFLKILPDTADRRAS